MINHSDLRGFTEGWRVQRSSLLAVAALVVLHGVALAQPQPPIETTNLTVNGGTARVVNAGSPFFLDEFGTTPFGVYSAGNPIMGYCFPDDPALCSSQPFVRQPFAQMIVTGKTVKEENHERGFFQQFIVDNGGQNPAITGKEGFDTFTIVNPTSDLPAGARNAPSVWAMNGNLILQPGVRSEFAVGFEQDIDNRSGLDCGVVPASGGTPPGDCHLMYLLAQGKNRISSVITIGGDGGAKYGIDIGSRGDKHEEEGPEPFATEADIRISDSARFGIHFTTPAPVTKNSSELAKRMGATILDQSHSPHAFLAEGKYDFSVFEARSNGYFGFESSRDKSGADFAVSQTRSPIGLIITGHHNTGAILEESTSDASGATQVSLQTRGEKRFATINLEDKSPVGLRIAGNHSVGIDLAADATPSAIKMRPGQAVCWEQHSCVIWTQGDGFRFTNRTSAGVLQNVARIDNNGDLWLRGTVHPTAQTGGGL